MFSSYRMTLLINLTLKFMFFNAEEITFVSKDRNSAQKRGPKIFYKRAKPISAKGVGMVLGGPPSNFSATCFQFFVYYSFVVCSTLLKVQCLHTLT